MQVDRRGSAGAQTLAVSLSSGESLLVESGAILSYDPGLVIDDADPGLVRSVATRSGIPTVSLSTVTANSPGVVRLAPPLPGQIVSHDTMEGALSVVQTGSFLAASEHVQVESARQRSDAFVRGEGLFMLRLDGTGPVFLAGYGDVERQRLGPGEVRSINTGYVVAFTRDTTYDVERVEGVKSTVFGDAGLVCRFEGPGTVWTQSRSHDALLSWLSPHLPD